jgi:hypothetical protein
MFPRNKSRRFWVFFALGFLTTAALLAVAILLLVRLIISLSEDNSDLVVKVITPVGTDYFSVAFESAPVPYRAYTIPVKIGTGIVSTAATLLDTGSADTWFQETVGFQSSSTTYVDKPNQSYSINYLIGSVTGHLGSDTLSINGFSKKARSLERS